MTKKVPGRWQCPCGKHFDEKCKPVSDKLSYIAWHLDAEKRSAKGEKQIQCPGCTHWFWKHELKQHRSDWKQIVNGIANQKSVD